MEYNVYRKMNQYWFILDLCQPLETDQDRYYLMVWGTLTGTVLKTVNTRYFRGPFRAKEWHIRQKLKEQYTLMGCFDSFQRLDDAILVPALKKQAATMPKTYQSKTYQNRLDTWIRQGIIYPTMPVLAESKAWNI